VRDNGNKWASHPKKAFDKRPAPCSRVALTPQPRASTGRGEASCFLSSKNICSAFPWCCCNRSLLPAGSQPSPQLIPETFPVGLGDGEEAPALTDLAWRYHSSDERGPEQLPATLQGLGTKTGACSLKSAGAEVTGIAHGSASRGSRSTGFVANIPLAKYLTADSFLCWQPPPSGCGYFWRGWRCFVSGRSTCFISAAAN